MANLVKSKVSLFLLGFLAVMGIATLLPVITEANPLEFLVENSTTGSVTASTTAFGFLSPGAGTTTVPAYDTYNYGNANTYATNGLALALQFTGSTTPTSAQSATTTYNVALEYSQDNIDWYSDGINATTTALVTLTNGYVRAITLGTQSTQGRVVASTTPTKMLLTIQAPTRYVRAIVTIPQGSTNGSVWGSFIGQKQASR